MRTPKWHLTLPERLHAFVWAMAKRQSMTRSEYVRSLVRAEIAAQKVSDDDLDTMVSRMNEDQVNAAYERDQAAGRV